MAIKLEQKLILSWEGGSVTDLTMCQALMLRLLLYGECESICNFGLEKLLSTQSLIGHSSGRLEKKNAESKRLRSCFRENKAFVVNLARGN